MSLTPNFELTPRNSNTYNSSENRACVDIVGATILRRSASYNRYHFDKQHENDELYFSSSFAADPTLDFTNYLNRYRSPHVRLFYNLSSLGANKELALVFGFDVNMKSRVLVYSDAEQLDDISLEYGDNQFLMEIESIDSLNLYFVHVRRDGSNYGGNWFFRGITGYVI